MSGLRRLQNEIVLMERAGMVTVKDGNMTIEPEHEVEVHRRIIESGPQGALFLMGRLDDFLDQGEYLAAPE